MRHRTTTSYQSVRHAGERRMRARLPSPTASGAIDCLSATDLPAAAITVKDVTGGDYSASFTLTVKNGRLALSNSKPAGTVIIVR